MLTAGVVGEDGFEPSKSVTTDLQCKKAVYSCGSIGRNAQINTITESLEIT